MKGDHNDFSTCGMDNHILICVTLTFILWRPRGMNEAIPATIGAIIVILSGSVSLSDLGQITETISGRLSRLLRQL